MIEEIDHINGLVFIVIGGFLLDWLAVAFELLRIKPITKILAMGLLISWTIIFSLGNQGLMVILLLLAQFFGLLGDIFLLLRKKWFLWGLGAFLVGHLFYLALIVTQFLGMTPNFELDIIQFLFLCLIVVGWFGILMGFSHVVKVLNNRILSVGVKVYSWLLSSMTALAFFLLVVASHQHSVFLMISLGTLLFLISDSLLAYNRFVKRIPRGQLWVRITYHLAQFSLAFGFLNLMN